MIYTPLIVIVRLAVISHMFSFTKTRSGWVRSIKKRAMLERRESEHKRWKVYGCYRSAALAQVQNVCLFLLWMLMSAVPFKPCSNEGHVPISGPEEIIQIVPDSF